MRAPAIDSVIPPKPIRITDVHVHVQPWRELKPAALAVMWRGKDVDRDRMIQVMEDPQALLEVMDRAGVWRVGLVNYPSPDVMGFTDRKSTRLNSSHSQISYAVFCLKKKKTRLRVRGRRRWATASAVAAAACLARARSPRRLDNRAAAVRSHDCRPVVVVVRRRSLRG